MKIVAYVCKKITIDVDDKFEKLGHEEDVELEEELIDLLLSNDDILGIDAIWDEEENVCLGEY